MDVLRVAKLGNQHGGLGKLVSLTSGALNIIDRHPYLNLRSKTPNTVKATFNLRDNFKKLDENSILTISHKIVNLIYLPTNSNLELTNSTLPEKDAIAMKESLTSFERDLSNFHKSHSSVEFLPNFYHKIEHNNIEHHIIFNLKEMQLTILSKTNSNLSISVIEKIKELLK